MSKPFVETRLVPDPSMSDAEYFHQRQTRSGPAVGTIKASVNMMALIGGFCRFKRRTDAQEAAAARYLRIYQSAQLGGAKAIDYTAVKVDTSGPGENSVTDFGADARQDYSDVVRHLGMIKSSLIERVVVHDVPLRKMAAGARARERLAKEVRDVLDELGIYFARA